MKRTFLIGVAAGALLAGANLASAQMMERQPAASGAGSGGANVEQKGGASGGARMEQKGGGLQQGRQGGAEIKADSPGGKSRAQAQDNMKPDTKGQAADTKGQAADTKGQARDNTKADTNLKADTKGQGQKQDDKAKNVQSKEPAKSGASAQGDSKAAGGGKAANLSTEQKTKIRQTVIRSGPRVTNVNFTLNVGTVVPRTVRYAPLPPVLVEVYPDWRGYYYFIVDEQIVIVEPSSFKIVTIISV